MYHSITFRDRNGQNPRNTYRDWHLIPSTRPVIVPAEPKMNLIEIPGIDSTRDLTELATGRVMYGDRKGTIEFHLEPGHWKWATAYREIANYLHGQRLSATLEDDAYYYYDGRFSISQWKSDSYWETISINYVVAPYKLRNAYAGDDWLWDDVRFTDSYLIESYKNRSLSSLSKGVKLIGFGMYTTPVIETTKTDVKVQLDSGSWYSLSGSSKKTTHDGKTWYVHDVYTDAVIANLAVSTGTHTLRFKGSGDVTVYYRGGSL